MPISSQKFFGPKKPEELDRFISNVLCSALSSYGDIMNEANEFLDINLEQKKIEKFSKSVVVSNDPLIFSAPDIRTGLGFVEDWWLAIKFLEKRLNGIGIVDGTGFSLVCRHIGIVEPAKCRTPEKGVICRKLDFKSHFSLSGQKPMTILKDYVSLPSTSLIYWLAFNPRFCCELGQGSLPGLIIPGVTFDDDDNLVPMITCRGREVIIGSTRTDRKSNCMLPLYVA